MFSTSIVTSFIKNDDKILILKRSDKVKTMKCLWAGVSGIIEKNDITPLARAKIEIFEETGINEKEIELLKSIEQIRILSPFLINDVTIFVKRKLLFFNCLDHCR